MTGPESYDSADTAILVDQNAKENTLTFLNLELGRRYTLSMDGTTRMYDKYGQSMSLDQFAVGDIVDITFLKSKSISQQWACPLPHGVIRMCQIMN